ncbi:melanoregulin isoform X2 [Rhineura floridana]|uniref:melanoregulin isoform X2 n=1 Tax=Rhineura floridana TaxID=261503 RepID=UPI002AC85562|nr:melanoregulin isoform X2 [Rhineura floridana]XP_061463702.1 melanoregulin isoform X2 [Rhineura floridana]
MRRRVQQSNLLPDGALYHKWIVQFCTTRFCRNQQGTLPVPLPGVLNSQFLTIGWPSTAAEEHHVIAVTCWNCSEWQKLNYDIYTLRQMRKEVRNRWKRILEDLGFHKEADTLLSVTKRSIVSDSRNMSKAYEILLKLSEETTIFPTSWELSERYLFVVDRLIALDAADEFFRIASVTYPKRM